MTGLGTIGFIGVGEIAAAMITGLAGGPHGPARIVLSPRGKAVSARLSAEFPTVTVAESNARVAAQADVVIVCVLPEQLQEALTGVEFRPGQLVISALAGVDLRVVQDVVGAQVTVVRAIPMPPVARRDCVTVIHPAHPTAKAIFDLLGGALELATEAELAVYSSLTATVSGFYKYLDLLCAWAGDHGAQRADTEPFVRGLFASLAPALRDPDTAMADLPTHAETPGGLNEQLRKQFFDANQDALHSALDGLYARVTGD